MGMTNSKGNWKLNCTITIQLPIGIGHAESDTQLIHTLMIVLKVNFNHLSYQ